MARARGRARVRDKDRGARKVVEAIRTLRGHVTIGVHAAEGAAPHVGSGDETTVADVAVLTEYGTAERPAQSWLRKSVDALRARFERALVTQAREVVKLRVTRARALETVGESAAEQIEKRAPRETGQLAESIRARVQLSRSRPT